MNFLKGFYFVTALIALTKGFAQDLVIPIPGPITSLAVQANGQFLAVHRASVMRFNKDGTIDTTFPGSLLLSGLAIENEMTLLVKDFTAIRRLNADGVQVSSISGSFNSFILQPDGRLIVWERTSLSRRDPDGTLDPSFISSPLQSVRAACSPAIQEDGKIVLGPTRDGLILRFHPDGTPDTNFHASTVGPPLVNALLVQPDGKIVLGGEFMKVGDAVRYGLARLNPDGSVDPAFNPASDDWTAIYSLALQANGKIFLSGRFNSMNGQSSTNFARLTPEGTLDTSFPVGTFERPTAFSSPVALDEDGAVLAGFFTNLVRIANPDPATQSFTREGSTLTWLRGGSSQEIFHTRFQASLDGNTWTDLGVGKRINGGWRLEGATVPDGSRFRVRGYVTGTSYYLDYVQGPPAILAQPFDRTNDVNTVSVLRLFANGSGPLSFQWFKNGQALAGARSSTLPLSNVTGADSGGYSVIVSNNEGSTTSRVAQLTVLDPVIFAQPKSVWANAGSPFTLSVTAAGTGLTYQWKKDGESIPGATSSTLIVTNPGPSQGGNYRAVLTGTYGTVESEIASVRMNRALPDGWNPKYLATTEWFPIQTVSVQGNEFFMGGLFRTLDAPLRTHLAKFRSDGSVDPLFAPEPNEGEISGVAAITVAPNGQLLVGGNFLGIAGESQPYLARLQPDGTLDRQFRPVLEGPLAGQYPQVTAIEFQPDGRILIGGDFYNVNGQLRPGAARLFPDGTLDESFNPDIDSVPRVTWGFVVQPDGKIIAYGWDLRRVYPDGTRDDDFTEAITASTFGNVLLLPNNQLLVESQAGFLEPNITLINSDGTVDLNFTGPTRGTLEALQADGKILIHKLVQTDRITNVVGNTTTITGGYQHVLFRFNPDGTEDPSFSPVLDNYGSVMAMRADGRFIIAGRFTNVAGQVLPGLAQLRNTEPATQLLTLDGTNATWLRGGTSPEVTRTIFEFSSDGRSWTNLGAGIRIAGGWQLAGVQLSSRGTLRARGFLKGSIYQAAIEIAVGVKVGTATYDPATKQMMLETSATNGTLVVVEMSTDLRQWTSLRTNLVATQPLQLAITNLSSPYAFFRLRQNN